MRYFNVTGSCSPKRHYMVNIQSRLAEIKKMIDKGDYFTINRARQYGKTTILQALKHFLEPDYLVVSLDFQRLSYKNFESEDAFTAAFSREILVCVENSAIPDEIRNQLRDFYEGGSRKSGLSNLFFCLSKWCDKSDKPIVLIIDEIDSALDNQIFLDFLSLLRGYYINRDNIAAFHSVILAGVYDIKNIRQKIRPEKEHRWNSPWNIAADFTLDMSFHPEDIANMLEEYEKDYHTGMDIKWISELIYAYTSGYPFLVSRICKLTDEQIAGSSYPDKSGAWCKDGILEAVKRLTEEKNTLFESLIHKLADFPKLRELIYALLFTGKEIPYHSMNEAIETAEMFGFVKKQGTWAVISNRIFEKFLYDFFLTEEVLNSQLYVVALREKNQFIRNGHLDMELVLKKFVVHFNDLYGDKNENFLEDTGRKYFLLYLKPIINGTGNYYIEAQTRNMERTDVIIDYNREQFVIEMKIWHGSAYNKRGEKQLSEYLDYYHLNKGYMISFNFNKKKEIGVKTIAVGQKIIVEAVV